jgi:hypothetical protein
MFLSFGPETRRSAAPWATESHSPSLPRIGAVVDRARVQDVFLPLIHDAVTE